MLHELAKSPYGHHLRQYLSEKMTELKDVTKVESWDEALGRKKAVEILKDLFKFLDDTPKETPKKTEYE